MSVSYGGDKITFDDGSSLSTGYTHFRNRIINGAMEIDQRNNGASVSITNNTPTYTVDRWLIYSNNDGVCSIQQASDAPAGFIKSFRFTTTTADTSLTTTQRAVFLHRFEGLNTSDLAWGTASAKTVTISFWVKSSLTGTFGGSIQNADVNRAYPFSYTISSANTWEYKTVTITGDTTGTWATDNTQSLRLCFGLGVGPTYSGSAGAWVGSDINSVSGAISVIGTLNATWQVTGVQLEVGSSATTFERRPYGTELQLCQRYYYKMQAVSLATTFGAGFTGATSSAGVTFFPVTMRTNPTSLEQTGTASDYRIFIASGGVTCTSVPSINSGSGSQYSASAQFIASSGLTSGQGCLNQALNANAFLAWSAEL